MEAVHSIIQEAARTQDSRLLLGLWMQVVLTFLNRQFLQTNPEKTRRLPALMYTTLDWLHEALKNWRLDNRTKTQFIWALHRCGSWESVWNSWLTDRFDVFGELSSDLRAVVL